MIEKRVVEFIIVPPEFGVLFLLPLIGSYLILKLFDNLFWVALFYITSSIGLASLAHYIYS